MVAELRHPWPDGGHRRVDRDGPRRLDLLIGHEAISRERAVCLSGGGAGSLGEATREEYRGSGATCAKRCRAPQNARVHICTFSISCFCDARYDCVCASTWFTITSTN